MRIEFDADKDDINQRKHGLSLADAAQLDFSTAIIRPDERKDYGEERFRAYGFIGDRMHCLAFTVREGGTVRAISFRKANPTEIRRYDRRSQGD